MCAGRRAGQFPFPICSIAIPLNCAVICNHWLLRRAVGGQAACLRGPGRFSPGALCRGAGPGGLAGLVGCR
eukprot:5939211-Heterocapsa_arctica.AAC.1